MVEEQHHRDTAEYATGQFRPHGRLELWREGSVIRTVAVGPFNKEAVKAFGAAWADLFSTLPADGHFVEYTTIRGSLIASPDAIAAFRKLLLSNNATGRAPRAVAWVVDAEVEGGRLMLPLFDSLYAEAKRVFRAFALEADAELWLRERMQDA